MSTEHNNLLSAGDMAEVTLSRSSQGRIILEIRTESTGLIGFEITEPDFACLMFGQAAVPAAVTRHLPKRRPTKAASHNEGQP